VRRPPTAVGINPLPLGVVDLIDKPPQPAQPAIPPARRPRRVNSVPILAAPS
jgi:hypothetical protein